MQAKARPVRSLTVRVLALASVWAALALVVIGFVISTLYRQSSEKGFRDVLSAHLYNVVNSISLDDQLRLVGAVNLGDLVFNQPDTGWYWMVDPIAPLVTDRRASDLSGTQGLAIAPLSEVPFDKEYKRFYRVTDNGGRHLLIAETEVELDDVGHAVRFRVSGNLDELDADIASFRNKLILALGIFGIGSLIVNAFAILFGLRPLDEARQALEKIRGGESERLDGVFPREIQPLALEINALIDSNRRIVERARMQVGNLAHSLKTPIAVLINESRSLDAAQGDLVRGQAEAMQAQVQSYLNRARIAAQRESILARCEIEPVIERLARVMRRLNPDKRFEVSIAPGLGVAMEQQDLEETVGNLLENAARFARSVVTITGTTAPAGSLGADSSRKAVVALVIEDDGPGLEPEQIVQALKRGKRLDESRPGTGLGLSIVTEITSEYQGQFQLTRGARGGLRAELLLPGLVR